MIAPVLPGITDVKAIKEKLSGTAEYFIEDDLNIKSGRTEGALKCLKNPNILIIIFHDIGSHPGRERGPHGKLLLHRAQC